jgi:hypothetical protein
MNERDIDWSELIQDDISSAGNSGSMKVHTGYMYVDTV